MSPVEVGAMGLPELPPEDDVPIVVAVGGLGTCGLFYPHYRKLLTRDKSTDIPGHKRFIAPYLLGAASLSKINTKVIDRLDRLHEESGGRKLWIVGHSEGAVPATEAAVERPDLVGGVSALGGVHAGIDRHTLTGKAIKIAASLMKPVDERMLDSRHPYIEEHVARIAEAWPANVPFQIYGTSVDSLVPPPNGFNVKLPPGQTASMRLFRPSLPLMERALRISQGILGAFKVPEGAEVWLDNSVDHFNQPNKARVIEEIYLARRQVAGYSDEIASLPLGQIEPAAA